jgi:hypothetical protein
MGGAATKPIECGAYTTPEAVEADYEMYANSVVITAADLNTYAIGLCFVWAAEILIWLMNGWIVNYFNAMNDILQCGTKNEVESKYGKDFFDGTFTPVYNEVMDHAAVVNIAWHPGIWYSVTWLFLWFWWGGGCVGLYGGLFAFWILGTITWWVFFVCPCCCYGWFFFFVSFIFTCGCFCWFCCCCGCCCLGSCVNFFFWSCFFVVGSVCYWVWLFVTYYCFLIVAFGLPQLLLGMNYATFWDEKGLSIGGAGTAPSAAPAASSDDADDDDDA